MGGGNTYYVVITLHFLEGAIELYKIREVFE